MRFILRCLQFSLMKYLECSLSYWQRSFQECYLYKWSIKSTLYKLWNQNSSPILRAFKNLPCIFFHQQFLREIRALGFCVLKSALALQIKLVSVKFHCNSWFCHVSHFPHGHPHAYISFYIYIILYSTCMQPYCYSPNTSMYFSKFSDDSNL